MRLIFTILSWAILVITAAHAQTVVNPFFPYKCTNSEELLPGPKPGAPALVNATLTAFPQVTFHLCNDKFNNTHYFLRAPERVANRICVIDEIEVFSPVDPKTRGSEVLDPSERGRDIRWWAPPKPWSTSHFPSQKTTSTRADGSEVVGQGPDAFMAEATSVCPTFEETTYAKANNVSPEMFATISAFWRSLTSSEGNFGAALLHLDLISNCEATGAPDDRVRRTLEERYKRARDTAIMELRTSLFWQHDDFRIWSLHAIEGSYQIYVRSARRDYAARIRFADGQPQLKCLGPASKA